MNSRPADEVREPLRWEAIDPAHRAEHPQHPLRDEETAGDVDRGEEDRDGRDQDVASMPPPRISSMPPMRMMPLMALVTLMSGVCSAGVTFQMTCQPTTHASRNTVRCCDELAPATKPAAPEQGRPRSPPPRTPRGWAPARGRPCAARASRLLGQAAPRRAARPRGQAARAAPLVEHHRPAVDLVVEVERDVRVLVVVDVLATD